MAAPIENRVLAGMEEGPLGAAELARRLGMRRMTCVYALWRLREKGLVATGKRGYALTELGRRRLPELRPIDRRQLPFPTFEERER